MYYISEHKILPLDLTYYLFYILMYYVCYVLWDGIHHFLSIYSIRCLFLTVENVHGIVEKSWTKGVNSLGK